ncbi:MAG: phage integrase N-terminal SAM-like domain-containing protein [Bacteriovoracaceae bacterium]|jgi:site-specific recombinase XerD|nr:phage integrase N-terminal SAM-like domain-containing protein [Bacteriovoracaceae bacterium]
MKNIELPKEQSDFIKNLEHKGKSFNTIKNYKTDLNCFNKYLESKKMPLILNEFTHSQAKDYSRFLINKYNSSNSIRRRVQALRIFFDYLIENNMVQRNPIKDVVVAPKVMSAPTPAKFNEILKLNEHLINGIKNSNGLERLQFLRNSVIFHLIYSTGLKVSDVTNLMENHILKGSEDILRVLVSPPKRDPYSVKFPKSFGELFELYKVELGKQKNKDNIDFDNLLFNSNPYSILSGNISPRGLEILFKDLSKKLGITITAKSLRQACIIKWIQQDVAKTSIKEWMGVQPAYSLKPYIEISMLDEYKYLPIEFSLDD